MPRSYSNGYRPRAAEAEEVRFWRNELAKCRSTDWQRAGVIMQQITAALGFDVGPRGNRIEPRSCRYCDYYGHTKQTCPKRKMNDEAQMLKFVEEDNALREKYKDVVDLPYDPLKSAQALDFDALGIPYVLHKYCGPVLGARGEEHAGKWTFDAEGRVVLRDPGGS